MHYKCVTLYHALEEAYRAANRRKEFDGGSANRKAGRRIRSTHHPQSHSGVRGSTQETQMMFNIKRAAAKAGISEGLLILWISTGKFKPSIEMSLKSTDFTGDAKRALEVYLGPGEQALGWNRFLLTDEDVARLSEMVAQTADRKVKTESTHMKGSHFTVQELAALWGLGVDKIRELFENEPDVIKLKNPPTKGKRAYVTLRIPEAVAARVQRRNS